MKRATAAFAATLMCLALVLVPAGSASAEEPNLAGMDLGSHAAGPEIALSDLRGRVVVVEYWGITCGPCIKSIPHTTELAEKYGHEKLVVIANQVWDANDRQCKDVWEQHAKSNYVAVINGGKLPGFQPAGVPSAVMFDHEGNVVWQGHPASIDAALASAVAKVPARKAAAKEEAKGPEPIVTGLDAQYFKREVEQINEQSRSLDAPLARLRRAVERASREDQKAEANAVLSAVRSWAEAKHAEAEESLKDDPATAHAIAESTAELLGRDELCTPLLEMKRQIESDAGLMDRVRSTRMLREVVAEAEAIGLDKDPAAAVADRSNSRTLRAISRDLRRIASVWPETEAGKQAAALIETWGLGE